MDNGARPGYAPDDQNRRSDCSLDGEGRWQTAPDGPPSPPPTQRNRKTPSEKATKKPASAGGAFAPGECHHAADSAPDCTRSVEMKGATVCGTNAKPGHRQEWARTTRERPKAH